MGTTHRPAGSRRSRPAIVLSISLLLLALAAGPVAGAAREVDLVRVVVAVARVRELEVLEKGGVGVEVQIGARERESECGRLFRDPRADGLWRQSVSLLSGYWGSQGAAAILLKSCRWEESSAA